MLPELKLMGILDQNMLVRSYFHKLLKADSREILNIGIYDPRHVDKESFENFWLKHDGYRIWRIPLNCSEKSIMDLIDGNHEKESGNSAVIGESVLSLCMPKA